MIFPDIPRFYTALAEFGAVLITCLPFIRGRSAHSKTLLIILSAFLGQIGLQLLAGQLPLYFWIPGMVINVVWMYLHIYLFTHHNRISLYLTAKAFVAAELLASLSWHLYCLLFFKTGNQSLVIAFFFMLIAYVIGLSLLAYFEKNDNGTDIQRMIGAKETLIASLTALLIFFFSNIGFIAPSGSGFNDSNNVFILRSMGNLSGLLLLFTQESYRRDEYLRQELTSIQNAFQLQYNQYQTYRENGDIISRKVHDLKHQIQIIKSETDDIKRENYLKDMEVSIRDFESKVETGNPILDTIISQKNRYCLQHGIHFSCLVQGELLNNFDAMDLSALFGNALDNAIEAVEKIDNPNQRLINLKVSQKGQFLIIKLDNYDLSDLEFSSEQLPKTSKADKNRHGIGLKSIQYICDKYQGHMTFSKENNWVTLKMIFPIQ